MAEYAQLKVELAKALEAQTGSQSEQMNLVQQTSELVNSCLFNLYLGSVKVPLNRPCLLIRRKW